MGASSLSRRRRRRERHSPSSATTWDASRAPGFSTKPQETKKRQIEAAPRVPVSDGYPKQGARLERGGLAPHASRKSEFTWQGSEFHMASRSLYVTPCVFSRVSHGKPQPVRHALCFFASFTWQAAACTSRPVFFREFHMASRSLYVTPCVFSRVSHGKPQPVRHALCFFASFTWQAPACTSRPVFFREFHIASPSLYTKPCVFS